MFEMLPKLPGMSSKIQEGLNSALFEQLVIGSLLKNESPLKDHTLLVGGMASDFANEMGFVNQTLESDETRKQHTKWREENCQPNYYKNVSPDPKKSCGPFTPVDDPKQQRRRSLASEKNHDTIGMVAFDGNGKTAAGTTTNGMIYKIPGRVGDSPIPGNAKTSLAESDKLKLKVLDHTSTHMAVLLQLEMEML